MNEDGRRGVEEGTCFLNAAACIEKGLALIADADVEPEVVMAVEKVDDLLTEVMDVDDNALDADGTQSLDDVLEQGLPSNGNEGFGHGVGERFEARSETCGEDHGLFHGAKVVKKVGREK